jgi:RHS repeat-associated protein
MNRLLKSLALFLVPAIFGCLSAQAQSTSQTADCGAWAAVKSWQGTYTITGSGSGNIGGANWTFEHQGQGTFTLSNLSGTCPGVLQWMGQNSTSTGSVNDLGTFPATNSCSVPTISVVGSSPGSSQGTLVIDPANGAYRLSNFQLVINGDETIECDGAVQKVIPGFGDAWPVDSSVASCLGFVGPNYTLPTNVGTLSETNFPIPTGGAVVNSGPVGCSTNIPWTVTFQLTPAVVVVKNDNVDDPCAKAAASSVGCQNQSLGEDIPIAGTGFFLHYEGDRAPGRSAANGVASADALSLGGWTLNVHHVYDPGSNTVFLGDGSQRSAWQFGLPVTFNGNTLITPEDGSEIYAFSPTGQHLQTLTPLTGALKYQFAYDAAGNLTTVTDASGNVTTIQRNGSEQATAIVAPFGQATSLGLDNRNFLAQVTDPAGATAKFTNDNGGLITSRADWNGNISNYTYDGQGRLTQDSDSAGGSTTLSRTDSGSGYSVTTTTAVGRASTFQVTTGVPGEELTNTWPSGLQATMTNLQQNGQLSENMTLPDGTNTSDTLGPDPRWGLQSPVPLNGTLTLGNLKMTTSGSRTAILGTQGNPFSLTTQTDTAIVDGRIYKSVFTGSSKTYVNTSPAKRTTTTILDSLERISTVQIGALLPVTFAYDSHGRISTVTQSTRSTTLAYDTSGFLASATDPLNLTTSFTHDADGRLLTITLPDSRVITYTYDANGNPTSVTPPGKLAHDFSFTSVDLLSTYTPPLVPGTGATSYVYNADRDPTTITRPDGETINFGYDSAGRLSSTTTPTESITYAYDSTTGNLNSASIAGGEALAYGYNGPLPTSSTLTGTVAGTVSRTYNNNFWVASQSINSGNTITFTYDNDGLLTKAGSLVVHHDPKDGLVTGTTLGTSAGSVIDSRTYDTFGELTGLTLKYKTTLTTTVLASLKFTRDADGRTTTNAETIAGKKNTFTYIYDTAGRLTGVKQNGTTISTYTYDTNSNRLTATTSSGTVTGTYDAQDRLLTYGNASYTYTANGELASMTVGSQTTIYQYDVLGNLIAATLPNGTKITYVIDARSRRVGKEVNGVLTAGFLYDGRRIVAQLNASNQIVSQFVYGSSSTSPDYMINGGTTYRIFSDQLGSPQLVVNTATGAVVEQISYDEFGKITSDTNPGFQPFGFAGGLYDQDTKLVRFGVRDYNAATGRWTAKDPILFGGGDTNLYGYAVDDPVNRTDTSGLFSLSDYVQAIPSLASILWQNWRSGHNVCKEGCNEPEGGGVSGSEIAQHVAVETSLHAAGEIGAEHAGTLAGEIGAKAVGPAVTIISGAKVFAEGLTAVQHYYVDKNKALEEAVHCEQ